MDTTDLMAQCCWNLQQSHLNISKHDLSLAKKHCVKATAFINEALQSENRFLAPDIARLAKFTISFSKTLSEKGLSSLLAQEKLQWLSSNNSGRDWFPVLNFGTLKSTAVAPYQLVDDEKLKLPKLSLDFAVEFNETVARLSIERQISALKFDVCNNQAIKPGTLALSDLYQDLLTNCSFVLSLLSIAELGMELDLRSLVKFHGNSRAKVELFFNGSKREIPITTRLPFVVPPHDSRSLHVRSLTSEALTWPAILEKAFLIALGEDYTFSGSNMAQDTYALIGWIPEIRKISDSTIEEIAKLWKLKTNGMVTLGLGTGPMSEKLAEQLEVVPEHDYVLSHFDDETKVSTLRNPWTAETLIEKCMQKRLKVDLSLLGQFSYLYINWNPDSFKSCSVTFPCASLNWPDIYLGDKPQYLFTNELDEPQEVIVLLEKYFKTGGDICISVWEGSLNLIYTTTQYPLVEGGAFLNLGLESLKFTADPKTHYIVSVSTHDKTSAVCSLSVFSRLEGFSLSRAKPKLSKRSLPTTGNWFGASKGGNWGNEAYINNPQYDLMIDDPNTSLTIVLASEKSIEIAAHLFHCELDGVGKRIRSFNKSKLLANESYTKSIFFLQVDNLEPGNYRIVVSAFDCEENDEYKLVLAHNSKSDLQLDRIPQALGTFEKGLKFEWKGRTRTKFLVRSEHNKTITTFQILSGNLSLVLGAYIPAVRASLFDLITEEPILLASEWNDSLYGVFLDCEIPHCDRDYILLIERFEPGEGYCRLNFGSGNRILVKELTK